MIRPIGAEVGVLSRLGAAFKLFDESALRLATGLQINRGADDPGGLIAAENLRSEVAALEAASRNTDRAVSVARTADTGLAQVGELLRRVEVNLLTSAGGGLSDAETEALQIENDAALEAINRIGATTGFNGTKLLSGSGGTDGSAEADGELVLRFAISPDPGDTVSLSLPTVNTARLGNDEGALNELASGGTADLRSGDSARAARILRGARDQVLSARARLGSFERNTLDTNRSVLSGILQSTTRGLSNLVDADFAAETSRLLRSELLVRSSIAAVNTIGRRQSLLAELLRPRES